MDSDQPGADKEWPLHHPVKVITNQDIVDFVKEMGLKHKTGPNVWVSPLSDDSVQGYATDREPLQDGVKDILEVVKMLEDAGVPCCMVAEPALIYYGTGRIKSEWVMCVPTELVDTAANIFRTEKDRFEPFRPSALVRVRGIEHLYPRFKFVGLRLFFVLMTSQACHLPCEPKNIEYSHTGLPYPKQHVFAQGLLDTWNLVDLEDLVDGMNLTVEWGEANLDLEGTIDADWGRWRADALHDGKASIGDVPMWCSHPMKRRDVWEETVSAEAKRYRQRHKYLPINETRFWKRGQKDPRSRKREFC